MIRKMNIAETAHLVADWVRGTHKPCTITALNQQPETIESAGCTRGKNDQVFAILMKTGLNNVLLPTLFTVVNNIEQYCYTRFSVNNVGSKTLFSPVEQRARRFLPCNS
jgi:hypothetical protein